MKILDLDMDYFMTDVATHIGENTEQRLDEIAYGNSVWSEEQVRSFLEHNLGLSKEHKLKGRIVSGHNESLFFWKELIQQGKLIYPFEVIHIDSHADLGLGYDTEHFLRTYLLQYKPEERPLHSCHINCHGKECAEGIGDYLLYAIAYRWINKLTYCANPNGEASDYDLYTLKNFEEKMIFDEPVTNTIQLLYNPNDELPRLYRNDEKENDIKTFIQNSVMEPEIPFIIIPELKDVHYNGDFDYAILAKSPNYTPSSADFIIDIFKEYINEI